MSEVFGTKTSHLAKPLVLHQWAPPEAGTNSFLGTTMQKMPKKENIAPWSSVLKKPIVAITVENVKQK